MTDPIRWGIVGASNFARKSMAPALHAASGSRVVALATRSADKAAAFAEFLPDLRVEEDYDALLGADDIDAIYVPLPNHLHVEWVLKALEAGKHVLCEKPIALHAAEADRLIEARDKAGLLAAEAFMIVHHPQWQRTRQLLSEGAVGRLRHVETTFSFFNDDPSNIRNRDGMGGGGLRDIGVYAFGSVLYATDAQPGDMTAKLTMEGDWDSFAEVTATFPDFSFHTVVSMRLAPRQRVVFHGDKGVLELTAPFNAGTFDQAELVIENVMNTRTVERWPGVNQYVLQVEAFCDSVRNGTPYPWTLEQSRGSLEMIDRSFELAQR
ncbi:Gfo/Idh/MocA family protein [Palleronia sp.]|uniref:Gfo/Idh/MocA family protein n=1 Tax=Palleronia sp. TaxID=1940284 RepID=UPI0035C7C95D